MREEDTAVEEKQKPQTGGGSKPLVFHLCFPVLLFPAFKTKKKKGKFKKNRFYINLDGPP